MIDHRKNEIFIINSLEAYLSTPTRPCKVIRQNQVGDVPAYPYVSYTMTTPISEMNGTYSKSENGTLYTNVSQIWSFTTQSNDQDEALMLAMKIRDYFTAVGIVTLADNNIAVLKVRNVTTRDNLISIQYEYRNGLDVTFGLLYTITPEQQNSPDVIETFDFKEV